MSHKNYTKYAQAKQEKNNEVVLDKVSFNKETVIEELNVETMTEEERQARIDEILEHLTYDMDDELIKTYHDELEKLGYEGHSDEEDVTENIVKDIIKDAVVINCVKLRIRRAPNSEADVYGIIEKGTKLTVNLTQSTEEFYKVNTVINETLIQGYCMKKFIELK